MSRDVPDSHDKPHLKGKFYATKMETIQDVAIWAINLNHPLPRAEVSRCKLQLNSPVNKIGLTLRHLVSRATEMYNSKFILGS